MVRRKSRPRSFIGQSGSTAKTAKSMSNSNRTEVIVAQSRRKRTMKALQEIKYLRKTTNLMIPKAGFSRLVRSIVLDIFPRQEIGRMQASALEALQESAEMYLIQFFEDAVLLAYHAKRVTLMRHDMMLMRRLRGRDDVINR